jgi:hypothetical protein
MLHKHSAHLTAKAGVLRHAAALVRPSAKPEGQTSAEGSAALKAV